MVKLQLFQHRRGKRGAWTRVLLVLLALVLCAGLGQAGPGSTAGLPAQSPGFLFRLTAPHGIPVYTYRIIHSYPHDPNAFTEGLIYTNTFLYESTGMWEDSDLRRVDLETGQVLQQRSLPDPNYFGEGLTMYGNRLIQLTYLDQIGLVYDRDTFTQTGTFSYTTQGWGLTHDGQRLIMSDGSANLYFLDPQTYSVTGSLLVTDTDKHQAVTMINELEYIDGQVYANIWLTNKIARIDPTTGHVTAWIDLTGLKPPGSRDVLNGIAYDAVGNRLFVTGKYWPLLFEIQLVPRVRVYLPLVEKSAGNEPVPTPTPSPKPTPSPTAVP